MRIGFHGELSDEREINAGFIGCGSHAFRNLYPVLQFNPVNLVATCDLDLEKAKAFASKFGAPAAYSDYREMLSQENLDAVFICVSADERGRPRYPGLAIDCLNAGCHVWMEKPPAATCEEISRVQEAARDNEKQVVVGLKKMFAPANVKARELMLRDDFGSPQLLLLQYPQNVPSIGEFREYSHQGKASWVGGFLDHICHPASLMVFLLGMPSSLYYERSGKGAGLATFRYESGALVSLALTRGASSNGGIERTTILSDSGRHITVHNNTRVTYHRMPKLGYGNVPDFYAGSAEEASAEWEPEFSLGQLYNKGLFILGYFSEVNEFARSILEDRAPTKGTLEQAWQVTRIFEAFGEGSGKEIALG